MKLISNIKMNKKKSVFAVNNDEYKKFSKNELIDFDDKKLSNIEFKFLIIINNLFCITLDQLIKISKKDENLVQNIIKELKKNNMIGQGDILNKENELEVSFFFLEKNGKNYLKNNNKEPKDFSMRKNNLVQIKKILEWNEILITMNDKKGKQITESSSEVLFFSPNQNKFFKANGGLIRFDSTDESIIFEIVRNEKDLEKKIIKKVKAFVDFCLNYYEGNKSKHTKTPKMILVFEDDEQMLKIYNILRLNQLCEEMIGFSTDHRINDFCCVSFRIDQKNDLCEVNKYYI